MTVGDAPEPAEHASAGATVPSAHAAGTTPAAASGAPAPPAVRSGGHHPLGLNIHVLDKLRQHNVGRVAVLYLGVCWVVLEPVHVVFHMLGVPEWVNRLVVIAMALGFPIAVIIAWIYAVTPPGLKPGALDARHSVLRRMSQRLNRAIAAVGALMVVYFLLYYFWIGKHITDPVSEGAQESLDAQGVAGVAVPQALDRGAAVRRHEPGPRPAVPRRRPGRGAAQPPRAGSGAAGRGPHLRVRVQEQAGRRRGDREEPARGARARGQRAQGGRSRAHHRAADPRRQRLRFVVGDL